MKTLKYILPAVLALFVLLGIPACKKDNSSSTATTGHMTVKMTDAPADYSAVYIQVIDVRVNSSTDENGWVSIPGIRPGIYNLLDLANGLDTVLCDGDIRAGYVNQIRLVLGDDNSVVVDSVTYHLETPSAEQSGLKINVQRELPAGGAMTLLLDFDAAKSIVVTGSGKYQLKPVIRVVGVTSAGTITGDLEPDMMAQVSAGVADDYNTYTDESGRFKLKGIPPGVYTVTIRPAPGTGFGEKIITGVTVVAGQTTALGQIMM